MRYVGWQTWLLDDWKLTGPDVPGPDSQPLWPAEIMETSENS